MQAVQEYNIVDLLLKNIFIYLLFFFLIKSGIINKIRMIRSSMSTKLQAYPLLFEPVYKDYLWGGRHLEFLGRELPEGIVAESWEMSAHPDGETKVANGDYVGRGLADLFAEFEFELVGESFRESKFADRFPLLIKILDVNKPLSVQVHPDDAYGMAHENDLGKSELWYVLKADDGAEIVYGLEEGVTKESFQAAVDAGEIETCLHTVPVKVGDIINIPSGVVHCGLGHGVVIAEVQQNSNSTYRVFDWNRVDANGKSRPLHLEKAMDVIDFDAVNLSPTRFEEVNNKFEAKAFTIERVRLDAGENLRGTCDGERFEIWGLMNGECTVNDVAMKAIQFVLLPASLGDYKFVANSSVELIKITI